MRTTWILVVLLGCADDPGTDDLPDDGPSPCEETRQTLDQGESTIWGTSANTLRVSLGGAVQAGWIDTAGGTDVTVQVLWPGGVDRQVFATANASPEVAPPLWCQDRLEVPALLQLTTADGRFDVDGQPPQLLGVVRAAGPLADLETGFTGRVPLDELDINVLEGVETQGMEWAVWAWWQRDGEGFRGRGEVRLVPIGGDGLEVGPPLASWD